jgi:hypothetical protein
MGRMRLQPRIDIYNLFNAPGILNIRTTFNTNPASTTPWRQPLEIFGARFVKLGAQIDF